MLRRAAEKLQSVLNPQPHGFKGEARSLVKGERYVRSVVEADELVMCESMLDLYVHVCEQLWVRVLI